jgi:hypothetical protein
MRRLKFLVPFVAGALLGCATGAPPLTSGPADVSNPAGRYAPPLDPSTADPLILDRNDLRLGTTVQFHRLPTASEFHDALQTPLIAHVVISLAEWPSNIDALAPLAEYSQESDVIVVLPGYPPSRAAAQAWGYVDARLRLVLVVSGPPPDRGVIDDLNTMRALERVIAHVDVPTRAGFERLQRPLSFRKLMN